MGALKNQLHEIIVAGQAGRILTLVVEFKWFKMINAGIKKKDYREIKTYWDKRLFNPDGYAKEFDFVRIRNGYTKTSAYYEFLGTTIEKPNPDWSPKKFHNTDFYAIEIGELKYYESVKTPSVTSILSKSP